MVGKRMFLDAKFQVSASTHMMDERRFLGAKFPVSASVYMVGEHLFLGAEFPVLVSKRCPGGSKGAGSRRAKFPCSPLQHLRPGVHLGRCHNSQRVLPSYKAIHCLDLLVFPA